MKLNHFYRSPFHPFYVPMCRKEAAEVICQWRRSGHLEKVEHLVVGRQHGYVFYGKTGESASMVLKEGGFVTR
jgi:hypothetical protein